MHHGKQDPYFPKRGAAAEEWVQDLDTKLGRKVFALHTWVNPEHNRKQTKTQISMVVHALISAFRKPRQEDSCEFKTSRVYTANTTPARTTEWDPVF